MPRVGRNDPCPCGSGKKYKHCCGRPQPPARVLYIHPAKQEVDLAPGGMMGRPYGLIPVGVPALVNLLRENGIQVRGLNLPLERQLDPAFDLQAWLRSQRGVRVILIDLHWYEHCYGAISVAQVCKEVLPQAWTVVGGLTASAFSRQVLQDFPAVDFVIRGDAEQPLLALAQRLLRSVRRAGGSLELADIPNLSYRAEGQVVENELSYCAASADLDRLDFAAIDFLEHADSYHVHEYIVTDLQRVRSHPDTSMFRGRWLCTARGCRYECSYCGGCQSAQRTLAGRNGLVTRSPAKVVEDLGRLRENRVIQASLSYDIAELGEGYWREFFERLRASGIQIGLYNEFFQLPRPEFIEEFARSADMEHSCVALSPLSGSERVRRLNGKFYSNDELFHTLSVLNQYNISVVVYFSLNLPGEDDRVIQETVDLAQAIYAFYPPSLLKILTSCHTIDPLSPMNVRPEKYGIQVSMSTFQDYYAYCRGTQLATPEARTEAHRGFTPLDPGSRSLPAMADLWDQARLGKESSWWPVPPGW
jgi:clorobiocin biosynthesis protein CloN6